MTEDFDSKGGLSVAQAQKFVEVGGSGVVGEVGGNVLEVAIYGETEWPADGGDAADNVSIVNGGSIPGVTGDVDGLDSDFEVAAALSSGDSDGFVEETEEAFDRDGLVVVVEARFTWNVERLAHGCEVLFESGAGVGGDEEAKSDSEEDVLHEGGGETDGVDGGQLGDDGEAC